MQQLGDSFGLIDRVNQELMQVGLYFDELTPCEQGEILYLVERYGALDGVRI